MTEAIEVNGMYITLNVGLLHVQLVMPISHRRHGKDKTVLSSPCRRCELNWRQDKTVLFCLKMGCQLSFVLSRPSFQFATVHSEIYWGILKTVCLVANSVHTADMDKTRLTHLFLIKGNRPLTHNINSRGYNHNYKNIQAIEMNQLTMEVKRPHKTSIPFK